MRSWRSAERSVGRPAAYCRLVLSFDPRDTPADMAMLAHHLDVESGEDWTFAIAAPDDVRRLADATGFWYEWDRNLNQFDHPAMLAGIRSGRLVRLLVGGSVTSARLDELVREVSGVFVPSYPLPSRARFRCVQFDGTHRASRARLGLRAPPGARLLHQHGNDGAVHGWSAQACIPAPSRRHDCSSLTTPRHEASLYRPTMPERRVGGRLRQALPLRPEQHSCSLSRPVDRQLCRCPWMSISAKR